VDAIKKDGHISLKTGTQVLKCLLNVADRFNTAEAEDHLWIKINKPDFDNDATQGQTQVRNHPVFSP
jgi:hypothetical protein